MGRFRDDRCVRDPAIVPPCVTMTCTLGSSFSIREISGDQRTRAKTAHVRAVAMISEGARFWLRRCSHTRPRYFQRASLPSEVSTPDLPEGLNPALVPTRAGFYVPCHVRLRAGPIEIARACPIESFSGNRTRLVYQAALHRVLPDVCVEG